MARETTAAETHLSPKQLELFREKLNNAVHANRATAIDICWAAYESSVNMTRVNGELVFCWQAWGFESWEQFVGVELGLHLKTAYAYTRVWEVFYVDLAGAWDTSLLLEITKMRHLTAVALTKANVTSWLKKAKKLTCRELVAQIYGRAETHSFAVPLTTSQMKLVQRTLDEAKSSFSNGEKLSRGQLISQIMREWADLKGSRRGLKSAA